MEWPICRLCGSAHDPKKAHRFGDAPTDDSPDRPKDVVPMSKRMTQRPTPPDRSHARLTTGQDGTADKEPFDRVAYQREYMRKYRERKRAEAKKDD